MRRLMERTWKLAPFGVVILAFMLAGCASTPSQMCKSPVALAGGDIVFQVAAAQNADAFAAGKAAAQALKAELGDVQPRAIVMAECFETKALKRKALEGVCSVFPSELVFGFSTYGSFGQHGCLDLDSVELLGIGGEGIGVAAALEPHLGIAGLTMEEDLPVLQERLRTGGAALARFVTQGPNDRLIILLADAHSPKNQFLVEGVQSVVGRQFPITGGSANKNAGQTFVYYGGRMYRDAAVALVLSGDFRVSLSGRQAKTNEAVIASAGEAAREAQQGLPVEPFAVLAFNCAGRKGKLDRIEDELEAIRQAMGDEIPLFGCYCAGEIGPADLADPTTDALSSGVGWHLMITMLGRD